MAAGAAERVLGFRRRLAVLVGLSAVTAALLTTLELEAGQRADRASTRSAAVGVDVFSGYVGSSLRLNVELDATSSLIDAHHRAATSIIATIRESETPLNSATAAADQEFVTRLEAALRPITGVLRGDRPDTEFARDTQRLRARVAAQGELVGEATRHSRSRTRLVFALAVIAVAGSLFGLAGALGATRQGRIALAAGAGAWLVSLSVGLSALPL